MRRYTRVVACLLLAWLPLQAVALPVLALKCHAGDAGPAVMHAPAASMDAAAHDGHNAHEHHAAAGDDSAPGTTDDDGGLAGHLCCTHFTAVTATVFAAAKAPSAHAMATPLARAVSHLPEPPQQPPRATPL
ncbi:MAG: hypothetical protein ACREUW_13165 [Burkholderiales bacterium]